MGLLGPCVRVGEGFGGFLGLREGFFYFAVLRGGWGGGGPYPLQVEVFFSPYLYMLWPVSWADMLH
jgi:hypothetical protein